jgi:hypothetical protein
MEAALPPFCNSLLSIHRSLPSYFYPSHEGFEEFKVDDVIFDEENVDGRDGTVK